MSEPATFTPRDLAYLTTGYRTLEQLCDGPSERQEHISRLIEAGRLPQPTYVLPNGVELFPPDYFGLLDDAGGVDELAQHFNERYRAAAESASDSVESDMEADWQGYLSGQFGVCLWSVTPESMVEKNRLTRQIDDLVGRPAERDAAWSRALHDAVDALDALERPFTDFDRQRWGETGRDRYITNVRKRYPVRSAAESPPTRPSASVTFGR